MEQETLKDENLKLKEELSRLQFEHNKIVKKKNAEILKLTDEVTDHLKINISKYYLVL